MIKPIYAVCTAMGVFGCLIGQLLFVAFIKNSSCYFVWSALILLFACLIAVAFAKLSSHDD